MQKIIFFILLINISFFSLQLSGIQRNHQYISRPAKTLDSADASGSLQQQDHCPVQQHFRSSHQVVYANRQLQPAKMCPGNTLQQQNQWFFQQHFSNLNKPIRVFLK